MNKEYLVFRETESLFIYYYIIEFYIKQNNFKTESEQSPDVEHKIKYSGRLLTADVAV